MDFQQYQKMFPSPQEIQQQMQQQHQNQQQHGFTLMDFCPPELRQQYQQQQQLQQQQQMMMMNAMFGNAFSPAAMPPNPFVMNLYNDFMGGQQQQFQQRKNDNFQLPHPSTFNVPPPPLPSTPFGPASMIPPPLSTSSSNGSSKTETPREIFFKTLSTSLKEANKFYCGKQTTWKNPFLYKTYLCENYCNRQYCRFGVNCWYAHGKHELRCIPESDDLPDQAFITQYLSFLGLPKNKLEEIIQNAYYVANMSSEMPWFTSSNQSSASDLPSFFTSFCRSVTYSPVNPMNVQKPMKDKFYSSYVPTDSWNGIQVAINANEKSENREAENPFEKSFHLFGNSINHQPFYYN